MTRIVKERIARFALFISFASILRRIAAAAFLLTTLAACRHNESAKPSQITLADDLGHTVTIRERPRRIVSLAPNITEIIFAIGADSLLVGVTDYCDYPPAAKSKTRVGGMLNPNLEKVLDLHPDLVLMSGSGNISADYEKLTSSSIPVFVTYPRTVKGVLSSIASIGSLIGRQSTADSLVRALQEEEDSLLIASHKQPRKSALMLLSLHPLIAIGPGTFLHELLTLAGTENVAANSPMAYPLLSREEVLRRQPDALIVTNDIVRSEEDILRAYPEWRKLRAVQQRRVSLVDASLVSRPGPRVIEGLKALLVAIHPVR